MIGQRKDKVFFFQIHQRAVFATEGGGGKMVLEGTDPVTRGSVCEAHRALYVHYISIRFFFSLHFCKKKIVYMHAFICVYTMAHRGQEWPGIK